MAKKSKITCAMLVAEGIVDDSPEDPRTNRRPKAVDVVVPKPTPTNPAPRLTDPPRKTPPGATAQPEATGLQRAINANIKLQGGTLSPAKPELDSVTGLQRAINQNIANQKAKTQT